MRVPVSRVLTYQIWTMGWNIEGIDDEYYKYIPIEEKILNTKH